MMSLISLVIKAQLLLNKQKKSVMLRRRRHTLAMLKLCGQTVQTLILHHVTINQLHQRLRLRLKKIYRFNR